MTGLRNVVARGAVGALPVIGLRCILKGEGCGYGRVWRGREIVEIRRFGKPDRGGRCWRFRGCWHPSRHRIRLGIETVRLTVRKSQSMQRDGRYPMIWKIRIGILDADAFALVRAVPSSDFAANRNGRGMGAEEPGGGEGSSIFDDLEDGSRRFDAGAYQRC